MEKDILNKIVKMRREGASYGQIQKETGINKSILFYHLKNIEHPNNGKKFFYGESIFQFSEEHRKRATQKIKANSENKRKEFQKIGEGMADDSLFVAGCMLYWGEGEKSSNFFAIANCDVNLLKFFLKFCKNCLKIKKEDIFFRIGTNLTRGQSQEMINFWTKELDLEISNFKGYQIDKRIRKSPTANKYPYGTCILSFKNSSKYLHIVYGGIKKIADINDEELWVNKGFHTTKNASVV